MRSNWTTVLLACMVAGCLAPLHEPGEAAGDASPQPLPSPRSNNPSNLIGTNAVAPDPLPGEGEATRAWKAECTRQWTSGAYSYSNPPVVSGAPCLFMPTTEGILYYTLAKSSRTYSSTAPAAPLPRADGFFDWAVLAQAGSSLEYLANGTLEPIPLATLPLQDPERAVVTAVRLLDGSSHVVVADRSATGNVLHHVWWQDLADVRTEQLLGDVTGFPIAAFATDGTFGVTVAGGLETSWIYVTTGDAALGTLFPATHLFSVDVLDGHAVACAGVGGAYVLLEADLSREEQPVVWTASPIVASATAHLAFACPVAITSKGVTVVVDTPPAVGGGPNPLAGAVAYTRANGAQTWVPSAIGTSFWSEEAILSVGDQIVFYGNTGNGTGSGNEKDGTELRSPTTGDATGAWRKFWGNFGRTVLPVPDDTRILLAGETWANQPFRYPWFTETGYEEGLLTWGVVHVPAP